jgi:hypothetical protein
MSKTLSILIAVVVLGAAAIILPSFIRARSTKATNACFMHLVTLDGAQETWARDNNKTTNNTPSFADLQPCLPSAWSSMPTCPAGGTYTIHRVGLHPDCSVGGLDHMLR